MKRRSFIKSLTVSSGVAISSGVSALAFTTPGNKKNYNADIVIYGGTAAAVTAAVQAKRMGKSVIIVSPDNHLGGMTSGGLGRTE